MVLRRLTILYLAFPILHSVFLGVRGSSWLPHLTKTEAISLFASFVTPLYAIAAGLSYLALVAMQRLSAPPILALVVGALTTLIVGYYFVFANMYFMDVFFPGLTEAKAPDGRHLRTNLSDSVLSPDNILFVPLWIGLHFVYEWGSKDGVFFPRFSQRTRDEVTNGSGDRRTVFLSRVPKHLRGAIVALEADKHYVVIHAEASDARLLYRFGDAVIELEALNIGVRVHRSWWVATKSVQALEGEGKALSLRLSNGMSVPVSHANSGVVRRLWGNA